MDARGIAEQAVAFESEEEPFFQAALGHRPVIQHAVGAQDVGFGGAAGDLGGLDVGGLPHRVQVEDVGVAQGAGELGLGAGRESADDAGLGFEDDDARQRVAAGFAWPVGGDVAGTAQTRVVGWPCWARTRQKSSTARTTPPSSSRMNGR